MTRFAELKRVLRFIAIRYREDNLSQVAGSLTFSTLFALVPLVTIVLTVFSVLPASTKLAQTLKTFIVSNFVPSAASKLITFYTQQFAEKASDLTAIGIAMLAVTSIMMIMTIDRAFNRIWRVQRPRPLVRRVLVYWAALTIGPLLIGTSVYITYWFVTASFGLIRAGGIGSTLLKAVPFVLTVLALAFLYRTVPSRRVVIRDAVTGAVVAGVAFEAMKWGFAYFLRHVADYRLIYGAFAGFPVFLLWLYVSWLIVLTGAVIAASLPQVRTGAWARYRVPGSRYVEALAMLRRLRVAQLSGGAVRIDALARAARLTWEDAENILDVMADQGWVAHAEHNHWLLARDATRLRLAEVFDVFVFRTEVLEREVARLGLADAPWGASAAVADELSLDDWCARTQTGDCTSEPAESEA
ncbi:MAG: YihY family inner membrane protein [Betaproteobacteria bacterium]|nr:YihY family inner membrane protein [Betaproteobacteria bacterium]